MQGCLSQRLVHAAVPFPKRELGFLVMLRRARDDQKQVQLRIVLNVTNSEAAERQRNRVRLRKLQVVSRKRTGWILELDSNHKRLAVFGLRRSQSQQPAAPFEIPCDPFDV